MSVPELTPSEVAERLAEQEDAVYLDVRTEGEFQEGHPEGALNIPVVFVDPGTGIPRPNPQFLEVCRAHVPEDVPVYVGCASGQRSYQAAAMMLENGYEEVANVDGGFTGKTDPLGNLLQAGWKQLELPSERGDGGERSWPSLRSRATGDDSG